jgi:two-component system response regulator FixJ
MNLSPSQQPRLPIDRVVAIVDDDREVRQSTAHLLRHAGYAVREFPNGDAFLSSPARHEVSGVILDLRMPGKDGLQVLREMAGGAALPVVLCTGQATIPEAVMAMRTGAVDVIEKPFAAADLIRAIEGWPLRSERQAVTDARAGAVALVAGLPLRLRQVLEGIATGKLNKMIAHELGLSTRTIEAYRADLFDRLQVCGTAGAVRIAVAVGMLAADVPPDRTEI